MATDNTQVTAYLPPHVLEYVESYCNEYGIIRKKDSKPLLATGIVDLLNILTTIPIEDLSKFSSQSLGEDTLEKKLTDSKVVSKLLDTLLGDNQLRQRLQDALIPEDFLREDKTLLSTLPVSEDEDTGNLPSPYLTSNLNDDEVMEVRQDDLNPYIKSLEGHTEIESKEVIEENKPNDEEVEVITPKVVNNGKDEPITEDKEDKPKKRGRKHELNENGLTEVQQKAVDKIVNIPTGEIFTYKRLADTLGVSRTVLDKFEQWKDYFEIITKPRGFDYKKK